MQKAVARRVGRGGDPSLILPLADKAARAAIYRGAGPWTAYRFADHPGLTLHVGKPKRDGSSTRTLYYVTSRIGVGGKLEKVRRPLGRYPETSLGEAGREAAFLRDDVSRGRRDLFAEAVTERVRHANGADKADTISGLAELFIERHVRRSMKSAAETERILRRYVIPEIGDTPVADLKRSNVADLLETVAMNGSTFKPQTRDAPKLRQADRVLSVLRTMIRWAISEGFTESDCTVGVRKRDAGKQPRQRALDDGDLATLWHALGALYPDCRADVVRLLILTGCRKSEVLEAQRSELQLSKGAATWTIPAARSKNRREHIVPLSPWAERIFRAAVPKAEAADPEGRCVFPSPVTGEPFYPTAINSPINRAIRNKSLKIAHFVVHDLRRSVATGMARIGIDRLTISKCLNHASADRETITGLVYDRHEYTKEKRDALALWACHLERLIIPSPSAKVLKRRAAIKLVKA